MNPKQIKSIIEEALKPVIETQKEHTEKLGSLTGKVDTLTSRQDTLTEKVDTLTERVDSITIELHEVHELANATLDVVKGRYEKNKKEIDEIRELIFSTSLKIKDHLNLPKEPYFGE